MFKPLYNQVLLSFTDPKERKQGVLMIPDTVNPESQMVEETVLAIGDGLHAEGGGRVPMSVKVGDKVLINRFSQVVIQGDKKYYLTAESNIAGILPDDSDKSQPG